MVMNKKDVNEIYTCEVCGNKNLISVLDLGKLPLCDDLISTDSNEVCKEYPTEIVFCRSCNTAHQKFQVNKSYLFPKDYHYRARFTVDVLDGMKNLVNQCQLNIGNLKNKKILDIGCNDGSLLNFFRDLGAKTFGIEPTGAAIEAVESGHTVINKFFDKFSSQEFYNNYGQPDVITFTNVFAHIEDLSALLNSLKILAAEDTYIVIENHYLGSILKSNQFDTFYHEHPRSYSFSSFLQISDNLNFKITNVDFPSRYGGNIRVFLEHKSSLNNMNEEKINKIIANETNFEKLFKEMSDNIIIWKKTKLNEIKELKKQHNTVFAKAFPGRAAILMRILGIDENTISGVYEKDGSKKIGNYVPGTRIPILPDSDLFKNKTSVPIINLAWHIPNEIEKYLRDNGIDSKIINIIDGHDFN